MDDKTLLKAVLKKLDVDVVMAEDGQAGLKILGKETPDLVILDLMMPKKGGLKVFNEMRRHRSYKDIPIVFASAASEDTGINVKYYLDKAIQSSKKQNAAAVEFLEKPVKPAVLVETISRILDM